MASNPILHRIETDLAKVMKDRIRSGGPITFRDYMSMALYDETHGFYSQGPAIGSPQGPFNTNAKFPAFGYAIALAITQAEQQMGGPLRILELGGGTGQMAKTIMSSLPVPHEYLIYDISPGLRATQQQQGLRTIHHLADLDPRPTLIFGNEVLDALPVHRVMGMGPDEFMELYVDLDENGDFTEMPGRLSTPDLAERVTREKIHLGRGQVAEICLELKPFLYNLRTVMEKGFVIFIDYGDIAPALYSFRHRNGTLRSYYQQRQIYDPFFAVGHQDLTADVDYTAVLSIARDAGFEVAEPIPQERWLRNLGLAEYARPAGLTACDPAHIHTLMDPAGLGSTFDVLMLKTGNLPDGPGLQPAD